MNGAAAISFAAADIFDLAESIDVDSALSIGKGAKDESIQYNKRNAK